MCGICGIVAFNDQFAADRETVARMRDTLAHRGPDDAGAIVPAGERVALGHRRLAIVDLSPAGHQPMSNEDGSVWITYNGEVYNHDALRAELQEKGHRFRSRTDTEAIVHLYEEEGPDCVRRLEGMFALAIWDSRRRQVVLARDRVGVKPLYFACRPGGLVFGSEVKALLEHPAIGRDLDEAAFYDYLTYAFTPPPATMYRGISKLAPAERLVVQANGDMERSLYWTPFSEEARTEVAGMSEAEMVDGLRDLLRESIRKRMMSDVPFGVFLSGGVDSSANVALMAEMTNRPVRTFATAPKEHARYDERSYAQLIADRFSTEHHEVLVDSNDMLAFLPQMAHHQDEPLADPTAIPQHFVAQLAREHGTIVVQCGEGSDELFHGYKGYADHRRYVVPVQRLPRPLRRGLGVVAARTTRGLGRGIRHGEALYDAGRSSLPYWGGGLCFRGEVKDAILTRNASEARSRSAEPYTVPARHWQDADLLTGGADLFQKMSYLELKQRLPELLLARLDRITMASSVEAREPFLDHRLVEFALALPPAMKYRHGVGKHVLKQAMVGILPTEVLSRPKQGFGTPMEEWMRGDFGVRAQDTIRRSSLSGRGLLDYEQVDKLFAAHRAGRGDWHKHLWSLYNVSVWHDRWIAGRCVA
jgi:asparagine synthase (glutamine-hydrolysing)